MIVEIINLIINLLTLFWVLLIYCSFRKKEYLKSGNKVKNSFADTVFDAFLGKEEKISEEEKRDREILDMIDRYDGKGVRGKEE